MCTVLQMRGKLTAWRSVVGAVQGAARYRSVYKSKPRVLPFLGITLAKICRTKYFKVSRRYRRKVPTYRTFIPHTDIPTEYFVPVYLGMVRPPAPRSACLSLLAPSFFPCVHFSSIITLLIHTHNQTVLVFSVL